jgi:hypothetical protein
MEQTKTAKPEERRDFFKKTAALIIGGITGLFPALAGLAVFFDPLRRKAQAGGFIRVTSLVALPKDGVPKKFSIIADSSDAWNKFPQVPVGAVYLRRTGESAVQAFNVVCPHAGCFVDSCRSRLLPCPAITAVSRWTDHQRQRVEPWGSIIEVEIRMARSMGQISELSRGHKENFPSHEKHSDWLDERTGLSAGFQSSAYENIPGRFALALRWGSTLVFTLTVQFITGVFLWMAYSPSSHTAWESVYYIQNEMLGGWLLRGLHHYTAQAMNVLLVLHLLQVVIDGAYKAPREINFWFGFLLLQLVLALSLTGYLLPWDQKGFWATKVTTNIMGIVPVVGPWLQKLIIGGSEYGHQPTRRRSACCPP